MSLLKEIVSHPEYQRQIKAAKEARPVLPSWDLKEDNTEDWKRKSAMQEGFDLCFAYFVPQK